MDLDKLLDHFPGAREAYERGKNWDWEPQYEDGYPNPVFDDLKRMWELRSVYPAFRMRGSDVHVHIHEMTQGGTRIECFAVPMDVGETALKGLFVEISHKCWQSTRGYLEYARITGCDPLKLCGAKSTSKSDVEKAALESLADHLATPHGHFAAQLEGGDEYTH
jgi:hypothetical protein